MSDTGRTAKAIAWAGLVCGALDITAAFVVYGQFGARPQRLLQGIAMGLVGRSALEGGWGTAGLGLFLHFVIAYGAATVFALASKWMRFLVQRAWLWGPLYGVAVYFFMQRVVLPLSRAMRYPFSVKMMLIGVVIHIFCVGLPIALIVKKELVAGEKHQKSRTVKK
jgi:hypothetical protein